MNPLLNTISVEIVVYYIALYHHKNRLNGYKIGWWCSK